MTRERRAGDWERDLAGARDIEQRVRKVLASDGRISSLRDETAAFDRLDFYFTYRGQRVALDVKEKRQRYSPGIQRLWPEVGQDDLFIVDETVFRRIVWQGGGGYLAIHDMPMCRWVVLGPWELSLGSHVRYARWGNRGKQRFLKGKLLVDLSEAQQTGTEFSVDLLLCAIDRARQWCNDVRPYPLADKRIPEVGS